MTYASFATGRRAKKRVRYRNTPVVLNSREHTLHEPFFDISPYHSAQFPYIDPADTSRVPRYDPFDPRANSVVAQYLPGMVGCCVDL